jgi:hypothetical protein
MQLSEKKIIYGESLNEIDFEEFFIPLKTLEKTRSSCSQFDALQDLINNLTTISQFQFTYVGKNTKIK